MCEILMLKTLFFDLISKCIEVLDSIAALSKELEDSLTALAFVRKWKTLKEGLSNPLEE